MEKFGGPELQKYAKIDTRGRRLLDFGQVKEFTGFSEALKDRFSTVVEFTPESVKEIKEKLLNKLKEIETKYHITFLMAERDYPLHSTLLEGFYQDSQDGQKDKVFLQMKDEIDFELAGISLQFEYVLMDGGAVLLVAKNIPEKVVDARNQLLQYYESFNLSPIEMEHILHVTLARISEIPTDFDSDTYKKELIELRHSIASSPVIATVNCLIKSQTFSYLKNI